MSEVKKSVVVLIVLMLITELIILVGAYAAGLLRTNKTENCWDQYQTEQQAIENCEGQD